MLRLSEALRHGFLRKAQFLQRLDQALDHSAIATIVDATRHSPSHRIDVRTVLGPWLYTNLM